ncbi:MAG: TonB-dependent receptor [Treponema sp.]|jgi:outer membrane cobalamin receptor|nr:TonB-dependent receptor [Treponema sp.]
MPVRKIIPLIFLILFAPLPASPQDLHEDNEFIGEELSFTEEDGITVTGTLQTSQHIVVIEKEEIESRNAPDIAVLLQETGNLNITRYGAYGNSALINIRGLDSKRLAFLVNGAPVNSSMDGRFDIEQIDMNSIERIEIIYGGSDTKYNVSGAMGGVINIITVKKQKPGLKLGATVSNTSAMPGEYRDRGGETQGPNPEDLLDTQNISISAAYGGKNYSFTTNAFANRAENHFLFTDRYGYTRRKDNNEVWDTGGAASFVWKLPNSAKIITSANFHYGDKNIPGSGFSGNFGKQRDISSHNNVMFDMPRILRDDIASEASLGWNYIRKDYTSPAEIFSRHDQQNIMAINRWSWYPGERLVLRSGLDYRFIYLDSSEVGSRNRHDGGIYLTSEFKPVRQFMIIPSVKAVFTSVGDTPVTAVPKLGILWNAANLRFADSLAVKNNYFRSFKFPDFEDLYWAGEGGMEGNPALRPEDGWGGDLGVSWRIKKMIVFNSTFFANWLKDSIHWSPGIGGIWRPENIGEAMYLGLENKIEFDIPVSKGPIKKIIPSVSYQYLLSYLLSFGYDFSSDKRIPYSPEHTIGGSVNFVWKTGSLLVSGHYESQRFQDRSNLIKLKPHFLLNAYINQKTGKNLSVFGTLRNILNTSYESFYDYPMPGFTFTLGMRAALEI